MHALPRFSGAVERDPAIDFQEGDEVNTEALQALVRAAVTLNKSKTRR
jgi:hypothetical protein